MNTETPKTNTPTTNALFDANALLHEAHQRTWRLALDIQMERDKMKEAIEWLLTIAPYECESYEKGIWDNARETIA